jgi:hypothetical protein
MLAPLMVRMRGDLRLLSAGSILNLYSTPRLSEAWDRCRTGRNGMESPVLLRP